MLFSKRLLGAGLGALLLAQGAEAGWMDTVLEQVPIQKSASSQQGASAQTAGLSTAEMDGGLKEALNAGVKLAVDRLGKTDGFLGNSLVKIPVPEKLQMVEKGLRKAGMGKYADDFIVSMNRAAETAVPATAKIFSDTIAKMSIEDAKKILGGADDAATAYFREKAGPALEAAILPIVKEYTEKAKVTTYYKAMVSAYDKYGAPLVQSSGAGELLGAVTGGGASPYSERDLDGYVTAKSVDGLFAMIAEEEKKIRTDPVARTTDLLKKVFGGF